MTKIELDTLQELAVTVPRVPDEVAIIAASDAREDNATDTPMEQPGDIAKVQTHLLEDGRQVRLSTAGFAILGYIGSQGLYHEEGWIRKPGNSRGILTDMANRIGGDSALAKISLGLCADQNMIELELLERKRGPILVNARVTSQGRQLHTELQDYYKPQLDWIDVSAYCNKIGLMIDEIGYMYELLGEEMPRELQALKDPTNVNADQIKGILGQLDHIMHTKGAQVDRALESKRERVRDMNWARILLQA